MAARVGTPLATEDSGEASALTREWRSRVDAQQEKAAQALESTAITLERLNNRMDSHDQRISNLEKRPAGFRTDLGTYGGCLGMTVGLLVSAAFGVVSTIISLIALFHALGH